LYTKFFNSQLLYRHQFFTVLNFLGWFFTVVAWQPPHLDHGCFQPNWTCHSEVNFLNIFTCVGSLSGKIFRIKMPTTATVTILNWDSLADVTHTDLILFLPHRPRKPRQVESPSLLCAFLCGKLNVNKPLLYNKFSCCSDYFFSRWWTK
jgi:hypothetical protein